MELRLRALVVDDDEHVAKTVASVLVLQGFEVVTSASAEDAWDKLRAEPKGYDVVVASDSMHDIDGVQLFECMRGIFDVRCVLLSSRTTRKGPWFLVQKPFSFHGLSEVVAQSFGVSLRAHASARG